MSEQLAEIHRALGRIEGKQDSMIERLDARDEADVKLQDRMRKVENRQHWYAGLGTALGTLLGFGGGSHIKF